MSCAWENNKEGSLAGILEFCLFSSVQEHSDLGTWLKVIIRLDVWVDTRDRWKNSVGGKENDLLVPNLHDIICIVKCYRSWSILFNCIANHNFLLLWTMTTLKTRRPLAEVVGECSILLILLLLQDNNSLCDLQYCCSSITMLLGLVDAPTVCLWN